MGKVFKPALRKEAIARIYNGALRHAGSPAQVAEVVDDKTRGLLAMVDRNGANEAEVAKTLSVFIRPWEWTGYVNTTL